MLVDKMFLHFIADAIATEAHKKFVEGLEPGGYALPTSQPRSNVLIVSKYQIQALADKINEGGNGAITATIQGEQLKDRLNRVMFKANIK